MTRASAFKPITLIRRSPAERRAYLEAKRSELGDEMVDALSAALELEPGLGQNPYEAVRISPITGDGGAMRRRLEADVIKSARDLLEWEDGLGYHAPGDEPQADLRLLRLLRCAVEDLDDELERST